MKLVIRVLLEHTRMRLRLQAVKFVDMVSTSPSWDKTNAISVVLENFFLTKVHRQSTMTKSLTAKCAQATRTTIKRGNNFVHRAKRVRQRNPWAQKTALNAL